MISIKTNADDVIRKCNAFGSKQLPYSFARALTKTAQDVQAEVIRTLPGRFTLRTKWYQKNTPFGFKIEMAKPKNLIAKIFTKAPWIIEHEKGAVRIPRGKRFAVPQPPVRRTKRQIIQKGQKPRALLSKKRSAFILPTRSGSGIFYRRTKKAPLQFFYALIKRAKIKPRLGFEKTARQVANAKFTRNFQQAFNDAVRTAK